MEESIKFHIANKLTTELERGEPYGVTKYLVDGTIEFDLNDVLDRSEELIATHGEKVRRMIDYIKKMLVDY